MSERRTCRLEHLSSLFFRVELLWAKQCASVYQPLSLNIVREVCSYYEHASKFLCAKKRSLYVFEPSSREWRLWIPLSCLCGNGSLLNFALMGPDRVLLTLRNTTSAMQDYPYLAVYQHHQLQKVHAGATNYFNSLLYDEQKHCVYLFGGKNLQQFDGEPTKKCVQFLPASTTFQPLPDMPSERAHFGCCWHYSRIYLCGGSESGIDVFDPKAVSFSQRLEFTFDLESESNFLAASYGTELVLVSNTYIWRKSASAWHKSPRSQPQEVQPLFWNSSSLVFGCFLLCDHYLGCRAINLETGEESRLPS